MIRDPELLNQLVDTIARFVRERLIPNEARLAEEDAVPAEILAEMKEMGLFGLSIPEEYGGLGLTMEEEALVAMEIGKTSPAFRSVFGTNNGIGAPGILIDQCRSSEPASINKTSASDSSARRRAIMPPAEPAPTTMKSIGCMSHDVLYARSLRS